MEQKDLKRLEKITQELFDLRTKAQERVNRKLTKYETVARLISRITEKGAYEKTKEASDYFFRELTRLNNEIEDIVNTYKKNDIVPK